MQGIVPVVRYDSSGARQTRYQFRPELDPAATDHIERSNRIAYIVENSEGGEFVYQLDRDGYPSTEHLIMKAGIEYSAHQPWDDSYLDHLQGSSSRYNADDDDDVSVTPERRVAEYRNFESLEEMNEALALNMSYSNFTAVFSTDDVDIYRYLYQKHFRKLDRDKCSPYAKHVAERYLGRHYGLTQFSHNYDEARDFCADYVIHYGDTAPIPREALDYIREHTDINRLAEDLTEPWLWEEIADDLSAVINSHSARFDQAFLMTSSDEPELLRALCFRPDFLTKSASALDAQHRLFGNPNTPLDGIINILIQNTDYNLQLEALERDDFGDTERDILFRYSGFPAVTDKMILDATMWAS